MIVLSIILIMPMQTMAKTSDLENHNTMVYIKNINFNKDTIKGFVYEITNEDTKETIKLDMMNVWEINTTLKPGKYLIREIVTAKGYEKAKDLELSLPMREDGVLVGEISIYPKHFEEVIQVGPPSKKEGEKPEYSEEKRKDKEEYPILGEKDKPNKEEKDNKTIDKGTKHDEKEIKPEIDKKEPKKDQTKKEDKSTGIKYSKTGIQKNIIPIGFGLLCIVSAMVLFKDSKKKENERKN